MKVNDQETNNIEMLDSIEFVKLEKLNVWLIVNFLQ